MTEEKSGLEKKTVITFKDGKEKVEITYGGHLNLDNGMKISVTGNSQIFHNRISRGDYVVSVPELSNQLSISDEEQDALYRYFDLIKIKK